MYCELYYSDILLIYSICNPIWENRWSTHNNTFCGKLQLKTIGKYASSVQKITHECLTSVVSEWMCQSTNPGYHHVHLSIKSLIIFVWFPCSVSFWVTAIVWCCGDEGIYQQSLLSKYASSKVYVEDYEQVELSFNFVHPCIGKLWLVVKALVDFISNGLCTN